MRFYDHVDIWSAFKKTGQLDAQNWRTRNDMYDFLARSSPDQLSWRHHIFDKFWHDAKCPYYNVYPSIIPMLTKIDLDLSGEFILDTYLQDRSSTNEMIKSLNEQLALSKGWAKWYQIDNQINAHLFENANLPHLLIRLPENNHPLKFDDPKIGTVHVKTIFISFQPVNMSFVAKKPYLSLGVTIGIDVGETIAEHIPLYLINCIPLSNDSLEHTMNLLPKHSSADEGLVIPNDLIVKCVKLCLTLRLISNDPDLIEPEVLNKDLDKYADADEYTKGLLVDKAIRRGKNGYKVGHLLESYEMSPHIRRPHPALVWTGSGKSTPKIVMRSGSIIHKEMVNKIPTGYRHAIDDPQRS